MHLRRSAIQQILRVACLTAGALSAAAAAFAQSATTAIPVDQIGAAVARQYDGDGLAIVPTPSGARLRSAFQKLDAEVTDRGLWITSTEAGAGGRLRLIADVIGRDDLKSSLPLLGTVTINGDHVVLTRAGLVEEYRTSPDGVRQDFVVLDRPAGKGPLRVELALSGASAAPGVQLTLDESGRQLSYTRLVATDATGKLLEASITAVDASRLVVRVDDGAAVYPLRIDPTFSDADWVSLNAGVPGVSGGSVWAIFPDGSGNIYVGGNFVRAGTVAASGIAKWDGSAWSALGTGMTIVYALTMIGTDLYAGGDFDSAGGVTAASIAKWNGTAWSALGSGTMSHSNNPVVRALLAHGGDLYIGGQFSSVGGVSANNIARWNGATWSALGSGTSDDTNNAQVYALASIGADVYAGGAFTHAGGGNAGGVAKWDGLTWSSLGSGVAASGLNRATVFAIVTDGTDIYAGGGFVSAGGAAAQNVAKWDGSTWSALGPGLDFVVGALVVNGGELFAGGAFRVVRTTAALLSKWNGSSWSAVGDATGRTLALAARNGVVYAGGSFSWMSGVSANIAAWNGTAWSAMGTGSIPDQIAALCISGTDVYAAGGSLIQKWNGTTWTPIGVAQSTNPGISDSVRALALLGTDLYVGGLFSIVGGTAAEAIAKWNGTTWSAVGAGLGPLGPVRPSVNALAVIGANLYAGGVFGSAGGAPAQFIAQWDGSSWAALGSGTNNTVLSLAVIGADLYAGGQFFMAGGAAAASIAKWNGSAWSALGSGMTSGGEVAALAVSGTTLYAGGMFTAAGGVTVNRVARWDGVAWSALGSGVNGDVTALATRGINIYAAGRFTTAGGVPANRVAHWDGSAWAALGSGIDGEALALAVSGNRLFVGGNFQLAGTKLSPFVAMIKPASQPFTDQPIVVGQTLLRAAHIQELRTRINTCRTDAGLEVYSFSDSSITQGTTVVLALHILELRTAVSEAYSARNMTLPTFADASLPSGLMAVKAVHIEELRAAVSVLEEQ